MSTDIIQRVDKAFSKIGPTDTPLCLNVWSDKYRWQDESYADMMVRVSDGVFAKDKSPAGVEAAYNTCLAMKANLWMPAGRILAGAGTPKRVTLLNCFVNARLEDDMASIAQGLGNIMLTMQQGGGIGTDFSPLRPPGAVLRRTGAVASGPGPFIDTWDSACTTIRSAGDRRGAMMGTLLCTHPFLIDFVHAKHKPGRWTNFNVSVLVTDAFMAAVEDDEEWLLYHPVPPAAERPEELVALDFTDDDDIIQYVYSVHQAQDLWDQIIRSTYEYAEPGVIFIDRVNEYNNLWYIEDIQCTNPCGEQPLPPHGCCDLGAINIARMVINPFDTDAKFNWELLRDVTTLGVRFLDNVIDVTNYPLPEQQEEEFNKRRIGIGIGGLADAMHFLGMRYGSPASCQFAERVMQEVCFQTYRTSIELAKEKGAFPLFDKEKYLEGKFIQSLPMDIRAGIKNYGIRNGVLLTIAPTGTTSLAYGNTSSGLEPVFAHSMQRKVRRADDGWDKYDEVAFGARLWLTLNPGSTLDDLPSHMNVAADVRVHEHIRIQEVCQKWVDASISKTINLPKDISYEDFKAVYSQAYEAGCKGCTTYRPSEVRGSILSTGDEGIPSGNGAEGPSLLRAQPWKQQRPEILPSYTTKIKWPGLDNAIYLTVGMSGDRPFEVFINSKDQRAMEWTTSLTMLMSMALRTGVPLEVITEEFQQVQGLEGGWAENGLGKSKYWPSMIAYLGYKLQQLVAFAQLPQASGDTQQDVEVQSLDSSSARARLSSADRSSTQGRDSQKGAIGGDMSTVDSFYTEPGRRGMWCPTCRSGNVKHEAGCLTCIDCGYSKCS
jgi:ribonucleoside-diphosphate reductase alpha chain